MKKSVVAVLILFLLVVTASVVSAAFTRNVTTDIGESVTTDVSGAAIEAPVVPAFRFEAVTTAPSETFTLPLEATGTYDFTVDWGDSSSDDITAYDDATVTHTYADAGTHDVAITGTLNGWRFNGAGDCAKIYDISEWGILQAGNSGQNFKGCVNLTVSATDNLNLTGQTSCAAFFTGCTSLTTIPSFTSWDWSGVTSTAYMLSVCTSFNQDLENINFQSLDTCKAMFQNADAFNGSLLGWQTPVLTELYSMLTGTDFNQPIEHLSTGNVSSFASVLANCGSFDQSLDGWDWSSATNLSNFLINGQLSTANYNELLVDIESECQNNNITAHFGSSQYSGTAASNARSALIVDHNMTITDGGTAVTAVDVPQSELDALMDFFMATGGANWTTSTNWGDTGTVDDWYGVTVGGGHVTAISLTGNNLSGPASNTLAPLASSLATLQVYSNSLSSLDVSTLTSLVTLRCQSNDLTALDTSQLVNLTTLACYSNSIPSLDLSTSSNLSQATCNNNGMSQAGVDSTLCSMVTAGISGAVINVAGTNAAPSATGLACIFQLQADGCTVTYTEPTASSSYTPSGTLHLATYDGEAMFFDDSQDYSGFAGTDTGITPYLIVFEDLSGNEAAAYGGGVGGGETTGTDLLSGYDFTSGWLTSGATISDADTFQLTTTGGSIYKNLGAVVGSLYKGSTNISYAGTGDPALKSSSTFSFYSFGTGAQSGYATAKNALVYFRISPSGTVSTDIDVNSAALELITDISATGLHLMSAENGTTRNMLYTNPSFDPNDVVSVKLYTSIVEVSDVPQIEAQALAAFTMQPMGIAGRRTQGGRLTLL